MAPTDTIDQKPAETTQAEGQPEPAATALQRRETKTPVRMGVAPQSVDEAWRLAQLVAGSDLVPKDFRGKPHNVLIAMELGLEVGVPWLQAVQGTAVINGRPGFFGDLFLGVIMASPLYLDHDEYFEVSVERTVQEDGKAVKRLVFERRDGLVAEDWKRDDTAAVCTFYRRGKERPTTRRFTVGQAKKANLLAKQGPWQEYPDRQLQMRARSFAGRDTFPEALKGVKTAEELRDYPEPEVIETPKEVRRLSETALRAETAPATVAAPAAALATTEVVLAPALVANVEQFMGGFTLTLGDGTKVDLTETADAIELEKFKGTKHRVRLTCARSGDGNLQLQSFGIAD
jgi:RecT family